MFQIFIRRPILSTVISILIVLLGVLAYIGLPVTQYPEIAPPTVIVTANYTGANADVVLRNVVVPLEEQINGVEGMTYMTSSSTNDGVATITIYFKLGTNSDINAVNVQNRVQRATNILPAEVNRAGVTVDKQQSSNLFFFSITSDKPDYDQKYLSNFANINIVPELKRIPGVGGVTVFGTNDYSMRIWLKPDLMATYGLTPTDVIDALAEQNLDAAPGQFGENSDQVFQFTIQYSGRLKDTTQFGNIVMRSGITGQILRLKDIARIELGTLNYSSAQGTDDKPAAVIAVSQTAGSNAQKIIEETIKSLDKASKTFPAGVKYISLYNINDFLTASIEKVVETLVIAYFLVFLVVFIFLQDFRSTLIPAASVLVSIVGTFACLSLFGFTINLLTLFALVLAIGIVVDDAIVVVEAVHAKLDEGYRSVKKAALDTMNTLSRTIIAITLVMASVFIPVSFISGSSGVFFRQFGLTLASAIIISAINALTLSPALSALLLKPRPDIENGKKKSFSERFKNGFNSGLSSLKNRYQGSLSFLSRKKWIVVAVATCAVLLLVFFIRTIPNGFVPDEDQGVLFADISLPPGSSLERTSEITAEVDSIVASLTEVIDRGTVTGRSIINGAGSNFAFLIIKLKPWNDRSGVKVEQVIGELFGKTAGIKDARVLFFAPPTIIGFGIAGGFSVELQDKSGSSIEAFNKVAGRFLGALNQRPEVLYAATGFDPNYPQYLMKVNVAKVKEAGVSVSALLNTMQGYYGGIYASNFNQFGKQYRVMVQAEASYRNNPQSLNAIYVQNGTGGMAPISAFVTMTKITGPQSISRFNLYTSISVTGRPKPGFSSGDALLAIEQVAAETLPDGYSFDYSGVSREEKNSGSQTVLIYILCLVFVFFLLSALYESYLIPLAVLFSLPVGLMGVYLFAKILGIDNNIYMQIAVVMLIGLLAKNAILIVEYALERRRIGMTITDAAIEGATSRLRPILMTSLAFIAGLLPLMFASGVGAAGNRSIGTGAVGGMLVGTLFGIFVIPGMYIIFQTLQEKLGGSPEQNAEKQRKEDEETRIFEASQHIT
ncbi:MAG TPA: efflux RND transporter permease subunit, partial [Puia sp.]|nr:efflux RND transporter permease subunit [Puia sp.]